MDTTADLQTSESYTRTLDYLFNLQRVGVKYSLDNIRQLLNILGNPHRRLPAIHIAGTNGKGSTAAMLFAIAREAGLRTGLYTSPHLVDFRERIRINETLIPVEYVVEFTRSMRDPIER
ncbi:MAG TPA: bifunctional folylpolyglutamate synthase/dihydrofolate synthase, partial [Calditrichae bacterium]|nr:bifunctional folylpolyglutamate synthase/dihydrofolate synthase [Calditrichia bacterium]